MIVLRSNYSKFGFCELNGEKKFELNELLSSESKEHNKAKRKQRVGHQAKINHGFSVNCNHTVFLTRCFRCRLTFGQFTQKNFMLES